MRQKDDEINDLRKKIEELSNEFARMLKVINFTKGNIRENARKNCISIMG